MLKTDPFLGLATRVGHCPIPMAGCAVSASDRGRESGRCDRGSSRPGALSCPSWAALGWLETSIRSYAKFVDVAAKATASDDGEADVWRRERMAIEEVQALLNEMMDGETCPSCGQSIADPTGN